MSNKILLRGCAPEPLIHYLKALGVMRLVAEQLDRQVRGAWRADGFLLETTATEDELIDFFLNDYKPTPIVAPWNNSSGFYPKDKKQRGFVESLCASKSPRFDDFRATVEKAREIVGARIEAPKEDEKAAMLREARRSFPESALAWLDAAFVLGTEKPDYLPLLGSGGNDGRFDFTVNLFEKWLAVLPQEHFTEKQKTTSKNQLQAALFQIPVGLEKAAVGQFHPGGAGGANASQGVDGGALVNSWEFIFLIEGSLLLASATVRQLAAGARSRASFPFTANSSTIGYGTATDGEKIRAELWLPLWSSPTSYTEIAHIFKEGRVQFSSGRRQARSGFDFARAVAELGVDRGIEAFQRYAFIERNGQANLATPLGIFQVPKNERLLTSLVNEENFNNWFDNFNRSINSKTPPRFVRARKNIEEAVFRLCATGDRENLQETLIALGQAESELAKGESHRERHNFLKPLSGLSLSWAKECKEVEQTEYGEQITSEYQIAAALAAIRGDEKCGSFRTNLEPFDDKSKNWAKNKHNVVWTNASLAENLAAVLQRRSIEARQNAVSHPLIGSSRVASLSAVNDFLKITDDGRSYKTDDARIEDLLHGLILIGWRYKQDEKHFEIENKKRHIPIGLPSAYALLKLLFLPEGKLKFGGEIVTIKHEPSTIPLLLAGGHRFQDAVATALRRLKTSGLIPLFNEFHYFGEGARLAAALLIPIDALSAIELAKFVLREKTENI